MYFILLVCPALLQHPVLFSLPPHLVPLARSPTHHCMSLHALTKKLQCMLVAVDHARRRMQLHAAACK